MNSVLQNNVAVLWIRDGVLVNRMHLNPVVFAVCYWLRAVPHMRAKFTFERLVDFGFEKSGVSCAEKMRLFNSEIVPALEDVDTAADMYNELASAAGAFASVFDGAENILQDLKAAGVQNFITSAIEQNILDDWAKSAQGQPLIAGLAEILGKRPDLTKGRDHFAYVREKYAISKMIYVADAVSEIETARKLAPELGIIAVGFANVIQRAQVEEAFQLVRRVALSHPAGYAVRDISFDADKLHLPSAIETEQALSMAGADCVITGEPWTIMNNLRQYFRDNLRLL